MGPNHLHAEDSRVFAQGLGVPKCLEGPGRKALCLSLSEKEDMGKSHIPVSA